MSELNPRQSALICGCSFVGSRLFVVKIRVHSRLGSSQNCNEKMLLTNGHDFDQA
jgi:hypothetical protein